MTWSESEVVSRIKITGNDQPKNLAALTMLGYEIYLIETTIEGESGSEPEAFFYYEAWRNEERLRAVTPVALLQLAKESTVHSTS